MFSKGIMYQSGCDICCVVLTLNRGVEVGLTQLISDRGGAEKKEATGGGRGKTNVGTETECLKIQNREPTGGKEEEKNCTHWTTVEMCRRRMPGVGNWRELM